MNVFRLGWGSLKKMCVCVYVYLSKAWFSCHPGISEHGFRRKGPNIMVDPRKILKKTLGSFKPLILTHVKKLHPTIMQGMFFVSLFLCFFKESIYQKKTSLESLGRIEFTWMESHLQKIDVFAVSVVFFQRTGFV